MKITRDGTTELGPYYTGIADSVSPCDPNAKMKCCSFTPYSYKETFKWALKMLILPGGIAVAIIILLIFELYDNVVIRILTSVFSTITTFLIYLYSREKLLKEYHRIRNYEILEPGKEHELNIIKNPMLSIGFVGDIMMMNEHELVFDTPIKEFFKAVPLIIGNLEGIMPEQNNKFAKQSHIEKILEQLASLLKYNNKWLLCTSNNHSVDFGNKKFFESTKKTQNPKDEIKEKFNAFGRYDVPKVFVEKKLCISTATEWSNQKCWDCTSQFEDSKLDSYYCCDDDVKFNILYPHWGFENERYTRRKIQKKAEELLTCKSQEIPEDKKKKWDLIFGHHPHTRQPVIAVEDMLKKPDGTRLLDNQNKEIIVKKLVAFSGGNFTSGAKWVRRKKHIHGIIMRCKIGPLDKNSDYYALGKLRWENTWNVKDGKKKTVEIGIGIATRTRIYILLIGIATLIIALLPRILELFP